MFSALLSLLPLLALGTPSAAAPLPQDPSYPAHDKTNPYAPDWHNPAYPPGWTPPAAWAPYPPPNPTTPAYPDYAHADAAGTHTWSPAYATGCAAKGYKLPAYAYTTYTKGSEEWKTWNAMVPAGELVYATVAKGSAKYTCEGGVYTSRGTTADHYDTSCVYGDADDYTTYAPHLPYYVYDTTPYPSTDSLSPPYMWHEYVQYPTVEEFATKWKAKDGSLLYARPAASYSPDYTNLPWVRYEYVPEPGHTYWAKSVLRTDTVGGMPATHCSVEGESVEVPFSANYYFYA